MSKKQAVTGFFFCISRTGYGLGLKQTSGILILTQGGLEFQSKTKIQASVKEYCCSSQESFSREASIRVSLIPDCSSRIFTISNKFTQD